MWSSETIWIVKGCKYYCFPLTCISFSLSKQVYDGHKTWLTVFNIFLLLGIFFLFISLSRRCFYVYVHTWLKFYILNSRLVMRLANNEDEIWIENLGKILFWGVIFHNEIQRSIIMECKRSFQQYSWVFCIHFSLIFFQLLFMNKFFFLSQK